MTDILEAVRFKRAKADYLRWAKTEVPDLFETAVVVNGLFKAASKEAGQFAVGVKPEVPKVEFVDEAVPGLVVRYKLTTAKGQNVQDLQKKAKELAAGLGVEKVRIVEGRSRRAGMGQLFRPAGKEHTLLAVVSDPIPGEDTWPHTFHLNRTPGQSGVGFAQTELHQPLECPLAGSHVLVAGMSGAGKSYTMSSILAGLSVWQPQGRQLRAISINIADPKRTFGATWQERCNVTAFTVDETRALLWAAADECDRRQRLKPDMAEIRDPTEEFPIVWLVVDELATYMRAGRTRIERDARAEDVLDLAEKARESGVVLMLGTQFPYDDVITTKVRGNMGFRICHRVEEDTQPKTVLGGGWQLHASFQDFTTAEDGEFYYRRNARAGAGARAEHGGVYRARGYLLSETEMRDVAHLSAPLAPEMPYMTAQYQVHLGRIADGATSRT